MGIKIEEQVRTAFYTVSRGGINHTYKVLVHVCRTGALGYWLLEDEEGYVFEYSPVNTTLKFDDDLISQYGFKDLDDWEE